MYGDEDLIYNLQAARETRDLHPVMCYKNWQTFVVESVYTHN